MKLLLILLFPFALIGQTPEDIGIQNPVPYYGNLIITDYNDTITWNTPTNEFSWYTYEDVRVITHDALMFDCRCELENRVIVFKDKSYTTTDRKISSLLCTRKKSENIYEYFEQDLNEIKLIIHK